MGGLEARLHAVQRRHLQELSRGALPGEVTGSRSIRGSESRGLAWRERLPWRERDLRERDLRERESGGTANAKTLSNQPF